MNLSNIFVLVVLLVAAFVLGMLVLKYIMPILIGLFLIAFIYYRIRTRRGSK